MDPYTEYKLSEKSREVAFVKARLERWQVIHSRDTQLKSLASERLDQIHNKVKFVWSKCEALRKNRDPFLVAYTLLHERCRADMKFAIQELEQTVKDYHRSGYKLKNYGEKLRRLVGEVHSETFEGDEDESFDHQSDYATDDGFVGEDDDGRQSQGREWYHFDYDTEDSYSTEEDDTHKTHFRTPGNFPSDRKDNDRKAVNVDQLAATWQKQLTTYFTDRSNKPFPTPPDWNCGKKACQLGRSSRALKACPCNLEALFTHMRSPKIDFKTERLRWHPDKFSDSGSSSRDEMQKKATEVFIVLEQLHQKSKEHGNGSKRR